MDGWICIDGSMEWVVGWSGLMAMNRWIGGWMDGLMGDGAV